MTFRRPIAAFSLALVATVTGCASQRGDDAAATESADYFARPAAALVFDPPASRFLDGDRLADALDRTGRDEAAVLGYDSPIIETSYVYIDDRQGFYGYPGGGFAFGGYGYGGGFGFSGYSGGFGGGYDSYQRRAITTREFVRVRP